MRAWDTNSWSNFCDPHWGLICHNCTLSLPPEKIRKPCSFLMFLEVRKRVWCKQMGEFCKFRTPRKTWVLFQTNNLLKPPKAFFCYNSFFTSKNLTNQHHYGCILQNFQMNNFPEHFLGPLFYLVDRSTNLPLKLQWVKRRGGLSLCQN